LGVVLVGANPTAVDATVCRIMGVEPTKVSYLRLAADLLGPLEATLIDERGESWRSVASPFQILDRPHLQEMRIKPGVLAT
jgi:uncharacterized protein (DUF362 family)